MKILVVFGTRPEAIKMAPIVKKLQEDEQFVVKVCVTAQHRQMLDQVLEIFEIVPQYDLNIMRPNQDLYDVTSSILVYMKDVLQDFRPNIVLVHGDTTTTFAVSLASFYEKIDVAHVEAGLRSYNMYAPWPEEANRKLTTVLSTYHFAPTVQAKKNLLREGIDAKNIVVTGNSVIDALYMVLHKITNDEKIKKSIEKKIFAVLPKDIFERKVILVTGHRRENFGEGFLQICNALQEIALKNEDSAIVYPVHLNPNVQKPVKQILSNVDNIYLIEPLAYPEFVYLMSKSYLILTDSGGIQEEAPSLKKPVLVMRDTTERPEAVKAGVVKLVGANQDAIVQETNRLLRDGSAYEKMIAGNNPYGNGKASIYIKKFLKKIADRKRSS